MIENRQKNQLEINPKSRLKTAEKKNRQNVRNVKIFNAFSRLKNKKISLLCSEKSPEKNLSAICGTQNRFLAKKLSVENRKKRLLKTQKWRSH